MADERTLEVLKLVDVLKQRSRQMPDEQTPERGEARESARAASRKSVSKLRRSASFLWLAGVLMLGGAAAVIAVLHSLLSGLECLVMAGVIFGLSLSLMKTAGAVAQIDAHLDANRIGEAVSAGQRMSVSAAWSSAGMILILGLSMLLSASDEIIHQHSPYHSLSRGLVGLILAVMMFGVSFFMMKSARAAARAAAQTDAHRSGGVEGPGAQT